jgi:hypothetical protein
MLPYTLAGIMIQQATIERLESTADALGATTANDWTVVSTVACRLWWWKGSKGTDKSASGQYARPQTTINVTGGDMCVPLGTDVTDLDRIGRVTQKTPIGELVELGPFRVLSVNQYETHIELSLERP